MDPVNRRFVWSFIEKFKMGRIIFLTTHSMGFFYFLTHQKKPMWYISLIKIGDKIAIMAVKFSYFSMDLSERLIVALFLNKNMEQAIESI